MGSPNTTPVQIRRDLHIRIKRLISTITLAGANPPSMLSFVNGAIEKRLEREEKRFDVSPAA